MHEHGAEVRHINIPGSGTLEVRMLPEFVERVRVHFSLRPNEPVSDDHVRLYLRGVVAAALEKVENDAQGSAGGHT